MRKNVYSQNGEDGIIECILKDLNLVDEMQWCVEFGAWDGIHCSNTYRLAREYKWQAIMIEADATKFPELLKTRESCERIHPINALVDFTKESPQSLDRILSETSIPRAYGVLSIDIDSYDLDVWESHTEYRPALVIIEIDSSIPPGQMNRYRAGSANGNSFSSTLEVASSKEYSFVCHTGNMVFVANEYVPKIASKITEDPTSAFLPDWISDQSFTQRLLKKFNSKPR